MLIQYQNDLLRHWPAVRGSERAEPLVQLLRQLDVPRDVAGFVSSHGRSPKKCPATGTCAGLTTRRRASISRLARVIEDQFAAINLAATEVVDALCERLADRSTARQDVPDVGLGDPAEDGELPNPSA